MQPSLRQLEHLALAIALSFVTSCGDRRHPARQPPEPSQAVVSLPIDPRAGGIRIEPESGPMAEDQVISITFPTDMIDRESLGRPHVSPVLIDPPITHSFRWATPRRGVLTITEYAVAPVARTMTLREGLSDLEGRTVPTRGWGAELASEEFGLRRVRLLDEKASPERPHEGNRIAANQRVELMFSRNVLPAEISRQVAFMDTRTHETFNVRVALDQHQPEAAQGIVIVEPDSPLPPDRGFWLVVERLTESRHGRFLPHLRIFPAGRTIEMKATWARAYNHPRQGKFLRIRFTKPVDPASATPEKFRVDPPVTLGKIQVDGEVVVLIGDFATEGNYQVTLSSGVMARDGAITREPSTWKVSIPQRRSAIVLESPTVAQRAATGLTVDLTTCRTSGTLTWQLARVSGEHFAKVNERLREFALFERDDNSEPILDPRSGEVRYRATEFLVPALALRVVASGTLEGAPGEEEQSRSIQWPAGTAQAGTYLLEIAGRDAQHRQVGNRCLVVLSDWWIRPFNVGNRKFIRVTSMDDSTPVVGARVRALNFSGKEIPGVSLTPQGDWSVPSATRHVIVKIGASEVTQEVSFDSYWGSEERDGKSKIELLVVTDGDVYEPGESVRYQILARERQPDGHLVIPANLTLEAAFISLLPGFDADKFRATLAVDASGVAEGTWKIPTAALSGSYSVVASCAAGGRHEGNRASQSVTVCDFRLPDFHVAVMAPVTTGDQAAAIVHSTHFHGAPHAGAKVRWSAEWVMDDWIRYIDDDDDEEEKVPWRYHTFGDRYSPQASKQGIEGVLTSLLLKSGDMDSPPGPAVPASAVARGEGVLDSEGRLHATSNCPFPVTARGHRAHVFWMVEVQGKGGESQRKAATQRVQFAREILALAQRGWHESGGIEVEAVTIAADDTRGNGFPFDFEMFRREVHVSKERVGDHLVRYRNSPEFTSVWKDRRTGPGRIVVPIDQPGDYVAVATPVDMPGAVPVSLEFKGVGNEGDSPVLDDFSAAVVPDKREYRVGESARLRIDVPFGGWATVSVETDRLHRTLPPTALRGDGDTVVLPILKDDFPNAYVRVLITDGGGPGRRPAERMGVCELKVLDPTRVLTVIPRLSKDAPYLPGELVTGTVRVEADTQPVPGATVLITALDEALLSLGDWSPPNPVAVFYPDRPHRVGSSRALGEEWFGTRRSRLSQAQKGFVIGGSGYGGGLAARVRENLNARPLWNTSLKTRSDGTVTFSFAAPDALTSYRLVAMAHTPDGAFGTGVGRASVSKSLRIKPFLPRFAREGDSFEVRFTVENGTPSPLSVTCRTAVDGPARWRNQEAAAVDIPPAGSRVVTRMLNVDPGSMGQGLSFELSATAGNGQSDTVRVVVPIRSAHVLKTEIHSGELAGGTTWNAAEALDRLPSSAGILSDVMVSGTPWLPKLANLPRETRPSPALADVAIGMLHAALRHEVAAYLPGPAGDEALSRLNREFQRATDDLNAALLTGINSSQAGWLPRWPAGTEPDETTTALVAFCLDLARAATARHEEHAGAPLPIPDDLDLALDRWRWAALDRRVRPQSMPEASPFVRCMALVVEARGHHGTLLDDSLVLAAVKSLYLNRETIDLESKCLLALANSLFARRESDGGRLVCLSDEQTAQLADEIQREEAPVDFRPETLGTRVRAEAIRLYALAEIGTISLGTEREEIQRLLGPIRDLSHDLTSQESLWVMLAALSAIEIDDPATLEEIGGFPSGSEALASPNGVTLGWLGHPVAAQRARLVKPLSLPTDATWMIRATHRSPVQQPEGGEILRLARGATNLTEPSRDGSETAPYAVGDYVLLTYFIQGNQSLHQLRIEESLPAALELVNPDLPSIREVFTIPAEEDGNQAQLTYADRRRDAVSFFFDTLPAGANRYAVLTRVVAAGQFSWPAAQAAPLYDNRFRASTADATVWSKAIP